MDALLRRRASLVADHATRAARMKTVDNMSRRAKSPEKLAKLASEVAGTASAYMRSLDALDRSTSHLKLVLGAFDEALRAEEAATAKTVVGARCLPRLAGPATRLESLGGTSLSSGTSRFECSITADTRLVSWYVSRAWRREISP